MPDAREYGLASGSAQSRADLLEAAKILIPEQNIVDGTYGALRSRGGKGQGLIDFFNKPVPRFLLLLCGSLALLLEFKLLGTRTPDRPRLLRHLLRDQHAPVTGSQEGTANLFELTLFVLGLGFLAMELFLLPGTALFAVSGGALRGEHRHGDDVARELGRKPVARGSRGDPPTASPRECYVPRHPAVDTDARRLRAPRASSRTGRSPACPPRIPRSRRRARRRPSWARPERR